MKAAIYLRSATFAGRALLEQRAECRRFAREQGHLIVAEYVEGPSSGNTRLEDRRHGQALLTDAEAGEWDAVIVAEPTRIARSTPALIDGIRKLRERGVTVFAAHV